MTRDLTDAAAGLSVPPRELLPVNVIPRHYHITLEPDFNSFTYAGTVVIDLDVVDESKSISLHSVDIDIHGVTVSSSEQTISSSPVISYNETTQVTKFDFANVISKGSQARLEVKFTGHLSDKMVGFYRSTYKGPDGTDGIIAVSQMQPIDARRAFPCFDEPSLKSKFTVTLIADMNLTALSNMDVASEVNYYSMISQKMKKATTFNTSPEMSTYLLAFVIGELQVIETNDFRVPIRVYADPSQDIEHGRFSLNLAARTVAFYEQLFGIDFPLPKLDMIAIPDFASGAMENWGLIIYRITEVMLDENASGAATKERVAVGVQHELAHQWFGNLVTMDWWEGLWLNEGFATWVSWYSCNKFFPEWKVWESHVIGTLQDVLSLDSLRSSHPIEVPVKRADEINQIFDEISYFKGSYILYMIFTFLGEHIFLGGVRQYLRKHAYSNAKTCDLWSALTNVSGKDVGRVMDIWTKHIGFPVVTVTEKPNGTIHLKQNRFLRTADIKPEEDEVLYPIFLRLRTGKDTVDNVLMLTEREADIKVPSDFFKLNANHTGLYRTLYSPERLEKLGAAAKQGLLSVQDRVGMIADAGALAVSGYQKTSAVLNLLKGFDSEGEFVVWSEILSCINTIQRAWIFEDKATRDGLQSFQRDLVSATAHKLGWEFSDNINHIEQQFKAMLFGGAGLCGDESIVAAAKDMFAQYMAGVKTAIHPEVRLSVFEIALQECGKEEYDAILNICRLSVNSDEHSTALLSLGRAKNPEHMRRTLDMLFEVKAQDAYQLTYGLCSHPEGVEALFSWMTNNWDELVRRLPPDLLRIMVHSMDNFTTVEQKTEVEKFFAKKNINEFGQSLAQCLDAIQSNISWLERDKDDVVSWLKENKYSS